jgi:hypothetical protein
MAKADESAQDFRQIAFTSSVNIFINVNKKACDPNAYTAHPDLLAQTSGYLRKLLSANPTEIHLPHWRIGTLRTYLYNSNRISTTTDTKSVPFKTRYSLIKF